MRTPAIAFTLASAFAAACGSFAHAQDWPARPVTLVVPYAAGGPNDSQARILAARLGELLHQQFIIENVGGAGGMTGANRVAKAAPDGYTLLLGGLAVLGQIPTLYKKPLYNAVTDFEHVFLFAESARILITRKDLPADNLAEFIAYAKANQDHMQYASAGAGSGSHVCAILLDSLIGTHIAHVPYRGTGPAMQDLVAGRVDFTCEQISTAYPQIKAGTVKALATLASERQPMLADLPTAKEVSISIAACGSRSSFRRARRAPSSVVSPKRRTQRWRPRLCASASRTSVWRWSRRSGALPNISPASSRARSRNGPDRSGRAGFMPIEFVAAIHVRHGNCRLIPGRCRPPGESM
jgi:tripartite-type tricarboxylate transporter receptor subunit TctC